MPENQYITVTAHIYSSKKITQVQMPVVIEDSINIYINGKQYSTIACSSDNLELLALGHLYYEGIIKSSSDIKNMNLDVQKKNCNIETTNALMPSSDIVNIISSGTIRKKRFEPQSIAIRKPVTINAEIVLLRMKEFLNKSKLHEITHGVHSAALYTLDGSEIIFIDDIGRHNAIDKIIGFALKNNIDLTDKMIFLTGRLASEIVYKILNSPVPVLISRASPTNISFDLAKKHNLIMIGRVREDKFHIFNGKENIAF